MQLEVGVNREGTTCALWAMQDPILGCAEEGLRRGTMKTQFEKRKTKRNKEARKRARIKARRLADPVFNEKHLAKRRAQKVRARERTVRIPKKSGPPKQTHCKRGHERTPENLYTSGRCKVCQKAMAAKKKNPEQNDAMKFRKRMERARTRSGMFTVYGLIDPRGPELIYVGCTVDTTRRLHRHACARYAVNPAVGKRTAELKTAGLKPTMVYLEYTLDSKRELDWIEFMRTKVDLLNAPGDALYSKKIKGGLLDYLHEEFDKVFKPGRSKPA